MSNSDRAADFSEHLLEFCWGEWVQLGVSGTGRVRSPWAQDVEALLLLTFEVGRADPRLFDEVLDWLVANDGVVSTRRLMSLCVDDADRQLAAAAIEHVKRTTRPTGRPRQASVDPSELDHLFLGAVLDVREHDRAYAAHGLARPPVHRSGKSMAPDLRAPIAFAMRLRQLLGVGVRAEVIRVLLTTASSATVSSLTADAGYARRNVQEALTSLHGAGVVSSSGSRGSERRYAADVGAWLGLLRLDVSAMPMHREWRPLLAAARRILRGLRRPGQESRSAYLQRSATRDLVEAVRDDVEWATRNVLPGRDGPVDACTVLDETIATIGRALPQPPLDRRGAVGGERRDPRVADGGRGA